MWQTFEKHLKMFYKHSPVTTSTITATMRRLITTLENTMQSPGSITESYEHQKMRTRCGSLTACAHASTARHRGTPRLHEPERCKQLFQRVHGHETLSKGRGLVWVHARREAQPMPSKRFLQATLPWATTAMMSSTLHHKRRATPETLCDF